MPKKESKTTDVGRLDAAIVKRADIAARQANMSRKEWVEDAIREKLARGKK